LPVVVLASPATLFVNGVAALCWKLDRSEQKKIKNQTPALGLQTNQCSDDGINHCGGGYKPPAVSVMLQEINSYKVSGGGVGVLVVRHAVIRIADPCPVRPVFVVITG
jgi:hypothetical protein